MSIELRPNRGPQERFLATAADIAIYGGAAGSGKSFAVTLDILRHAHRPKYGGIVFRRESTRLIGPGSIWEETCGIYPMLGAKSRQTPVLEWRFPAGALLELRHLQHEDDKYAHQGKQYAGAYFDEITEFTETQVWYIWSRLRSTSCRRYMRGTCNPDPDSWVKGFIAWWLDPVTGYPIPERSGVLRWFVRDARGEIEWADDRATLVAKYPELDERGNLVRDPVSVTFIAASLADNPKGDPNYRSTLMAMQLVERERLLGGNWNIRPAAGLFFKRPWFQVVERVPPQLEVQRRVRAWDKAATEAKPGKTDPDWTEGLRMALLSDRRMAIEHLESTQSRPRDIDQLMRRTAQNDGVECEVAMWQDPGQAGVVDVEHTRDVLSGFRFHAERASKSKQVYAGPPSSDAEGGKILVVRGPWNERFFNQVEAFPSKEHDDIVDALSLAHLRLTAGFSVDDLWSAFGKMTT